MTFRGNQFEGDTEQDEVELIYMCSHGLTCFFEAELTPTELYAWMCRGGFSVDDEEECEIAVDAILYEVTETVRRQMFLRAQAPIVDNDTSH